MSSYGARTARRELRKFPSTRQCPLRAADRTASSFQSDLNPNNFSIHDLSPDPTFRATPHQPNSTSQTRACGTPIDLLIRVRQVCHNVLTCVGAVCKMPRPKTQTRNDEIHPDLEPCTMRPHIGAHETRTHRTRARAKQRTESSNRR